MGLGSILVAEYLRDEEGDIYFIALHLEAEFMLMDSRTLRDDQ